MPQKLIVGNWKMNGTVEETRKLLFQLRVEWSDECDPIEVAVCPPFTALIVARHELHGTGIAFGAQNCYAEMKGAFTGEISPAMLKELGCTYVILGHSERRTIFGETDELISRKLCAALEEKLIPILCIGETEAERADNQTEKVLLQQLTSSLALVTASDLENLVIAYEPIWAIGTGKTATPEEAEASHAFIRSELKKKFGDAAGTIPLLYGGSVKPANARELFQQPDIDGGLIGGASLDAEGFVEIVRAAIKEEQIP
ncbi:MAG TPA: triose-phosphate isomerase [Candidatus Kapabacteria bacterium]|jgi:triosephosphate isomerase